jgi:hypothetical protein
MTDEETENQSAQEFRDSARDYNVDPKDGGRLNARLVLQRQNRR